MRWGEVWVGCAWVGWGEYGWGGVSVDRVGWGAGGVCVGCEL